MKSTDILLKEEVLARIQAIVAAHGGRCLSTQYVNMKTKMEFKCKNPEHASWYAFPQPILRGHWCKLCSVLPAVIAAKNKFLKIVNLRGGTCEEKSYKDGNTKITITCAMRHCWTARPSSVVGGTWCPECSAGLTERICRQFFEQMFSEKFPTVRLDCLRNDGGHKLQLDGYCAKLRIAFEYQGEQHYANTPFAKNTLEERIASDTLKIDLCHKNEIKLIIIPTLHRKLPFTQLQEFIKKECAHLGITIPWPDIAVDISKAYLPFDYEKQCQLEEIARAKNGTLLNKYSGANNNIKLRCNRDGYEWEALPSTITRGHWCPECKGVGKKDLAWLQKLAADKYGKCLASSYSNSYTKIEWKCHDDEHPTWFATANSIQRGRWCPRCGRESSRLINSTKNKGPKKSSDEKLQELKQLASRKGGKLLSDTYKNNKTLMEWCCDTHGTWLATPQDVKNGGTWCPECGRIQSAKTKKDRLII